MEDQKSTDELEDVINSLIEEIHEAADSWVFEVNGDKWSNDDNTAGDNYGSFVAGAKWILSRLNYEIK